MTNIKRTYELPDEVFDIIKSFMLQKYRRTQHGKMMADFQNELKFMRVHNRYSLVQRERVERIGWFYEKFQQLSIKKKDEIYRKTFKTQNYSIERSRKVEEKPKRFLRK